MNNKPELDDEKFNFVTSEVLFPILTKEELMDFVTVSGHGYDKDAVKSENQREEGVR